MRRVGGAKWRYGADRGGCAGGRGKRERIVAAAAATDYSPDFPSRKLHAQRTYIRCMHSVLTRLTATKDASHFSSNPLPLSPTALSLATAAALATTADKLAAYRQQFDHISHLHASTLRFVRGAVWRVRKLQNGSVGLMAALV